ncbi:MAG: hypothetical protein CL916_13900 [Deltaproteobacteria bacterium]|nr:hypothetical protein [Deltaproteobacteria bacterium]
MRKTLYIIGIVLVLVITGCVLAHRPIPSPSDSGEKLATQIEQSINKKAWDQTGIITWNFAGAEHIWDKSRELHSYTRGNNTILHSLAGKGGIHFKKGKVQDTPQRWIQKAYNAWINDSFWLNPLVKFHDEGVELKTMTYDGEQVLTVHFASGGNTPGDTYMWFVDEHFRPKMWRMWVSIIPIGGTSISWEGWTQISTGAWISTQHKVGPVNLELSDVRGAKHWREIFDKDPFAALVQKYNLQLPSNDIP